MAFLSSYSCFGFSQFILYSESNEFQNIVNYNTAAQKEFEKNMEGMTDLEYRKEMKRLGVDLLLSYIPAG